MGAFYFSPSPQIYAAHIIFIPPMGNPRLTKVEILTLGPSQDSNPELLTPNPTVTGRANKLKALPSTHQRTRNAYYLLFECSTPTFTK